MNVFEQEFARPYLLARDGYKCNVCKITIKKLIDQSDLKEKLTGELRKLPVVIIDCIDNSGSHRVDIYNESIMSNLQLACYPCNRNKNLHKIDLSVSSGREPSREKKDSLNFKPTYHRNLQTFLLDNQHGCFEEIIMNSEELSNGANEVTARRYLRMKTHTKTNKKGIYQMFPYDCNSNDCNGVHVCVVGTKPTKLLDVEHHKLESSWWVEYGDKRENWKNYHEKPFLEMDEYIKTHCILLAHNFK